MLIVGQFKVALALDDEITVKANGNCQTVVTFDGVEAFTKVTFPGLQEVTGEGFILFTGNGFIVIVVLAETAQPLLY